MALEKPGSFDQKKSDKPLNPKEKRPQEGNRPQSDHSRTTK